MMFALKIQGFNSIAASDHSGLKDDVSSGEIILTIYHFMKVW